MEIESMSRESQSLSTVINFLIDENLPLVSNLANLSRVLFDWFKGVSWAGFYLANEENTCLYLGPYQGPLACTTIPFSKGVCGFSARNKKTVLVDDVHTFKGHIACSSMTNSELVVPIFKGDRVVAVIDLDSNNFSNFTKEDAVVLEDVAFIISKLF